MSKFLDLTGRRYGRLAILARAPNTPQGWAVWLCRCDCGREKAITSQTLQRGNAVSCGCLRAEKFRARATTDGMSKTPEKATWYNMLRRCSDQKNNQWHVYGGRGITVCERWRNSFAAFKADMGPRPGPEYSIDRIDNDGNYEPGNCRWATLDTQNGNRQASVRITHCGRTQCLTHWARECGFSATCLRWRLAAGWSLEVALSTPSRRPA